MAKRKKKKRQKVTITLAHKMHAGKPTSVYALMNKVLAEKRDDVVKAGVKIAIAWQSGIREDADGHLMLGKCKKRVALERELAEYDFVICLNDETWQHMSEADQYRLMWHQVLHAEVKYDTDGSVLKDDKNRVVCRIRKHDIQEFREIADAYDVAYDMGATAKAALNDAQRPLFNQPAGEKKEPTDSKQGKPTSKQKKRKKRTAGGMAAAVAAEEAKDEK